MRLEKFGYIDFDTFFVMLESIVLKKCMKNTPNINFNPKTYDYTCDENDVYDITYNTLTNFINSMKKIKLDTIILPNVKSVKCIDNNYYPLTKKDGKSSIVNTPNGCTLHDILNVIYSTRHEKATFFEDMESTLSGNEIKITLGWQW